MWTQNSQGHRGKKGRTKPAPKSASCHFLTQQSRSLPGKHMETTSSAIKDSLLSCLSPDTAVEGRNEPHGGMDPTILSPNPQQ